VIASAAPFIAVWSNGAPSHARANVVAKFRLAAHAPEVAVELGQERRGIDRRLHKIRCADGTRTHPIKPGTLIGDENDLRAFRLLRQPVPDAADALEIVEIDGNDRVTAWRLRCAELIRRQALDIEQPLELPVHAPRVFGRVAYCSIALRPRGFAPPRPPAEVFVLLGLYVSERRLPNLAPTIGSLRQTTL
jgi:hypothetical protein